MGETIFKVGLLTNIKKICRGNHDSGGPACSVCESLGSRWGPRQTSSLLAGPLTVQVDSGPQNQLHTASDAFFCLPLVTTKPTLLRTSFFVHSGRASEENWSTEHRGVTALRDWCGQFGVTSRFWQQERESLKNTEGRGCSPNRAHPMSLKKSGQEREGR